MGSLILPSAAPANDVVAHTLHWLAVLLEIDGGSADRIEAYRDAALAVKELDRPISEVLYELGADGLESLGIDCSISTMVSEWSRTGRLPAVLGHRDGLWPALTHALCQALGVELRSAPHHTGAGARRPFSPPKNAKPLG
jgi:DNA polymerase/3'-5' exonuclease PolX